MVRVCTDTLINKKNPKRNGFYMEDVLKENIDIYVKNAMKDWDFVLIVSGSGQVRVGKSLLAMQIGYYWSDQMKKVHNVDVPFNLKDNFCFNGAEIIKKGNYLGENHPHSALVFDEAGADLQSLKVLRKTTQDTIDFLRECGQYNLFTILVLPDFFSLPRGIALTRTDALLDVFVLPNEKDIWDRGFFNFYSRPNKKFLYLKGRKELDYKAHRYDFHGRFYNNYPVDEPEYRKLKQDALQKREQSVKLDKFKLQRDILFQIMIEDGYTQREISEKLKKEGILLSREAVSMAIVSVKRQKYNNIMCNEDDGGGEDD